MASASANESGRKVAWGIMGTGNIARKFAAGVNASRTGRLVAVGSRTLEAAERFGDDLGVPHRYGSYDELLADPEVEVVYISLPNHLHSYWTVRCAEAKKAILCEKPLATNVAEAEVAIEAARKNGVFLMEAFMARCHPQMAKLVELIRGKIVGDVRFIEAHFGYNMRGLHLENVRQQNPAAGGGIMDVGCYTLQAARLVAGAALGRDFAEPLELKGAAHIGEVSRVDEWASATLKFPGDILASCTCAIQTAIGTVIRIYGSEGQIVVPVPYAPGPDDGRILIFRDGQAEPEEVHATAGLPIYAVEADAVAGFLGSDQATPPAMTWADSLGNMRALDMWRREIGLVFDNER